MFPLPQRLRRISFFLLFGTAPVKENAIKTVKPPTRPLELGHARLPAPPARPLARSSAAGSRMTRGLLVFSIAHIRQPLLLDYETHTGNHYSVSYSSLLLPLRWRSCPRHRTDKKCGRIHSCLPSRAQPNCFCGMGSCLKCTVMIVVDPAGARRRQARKAQPGGRVPCGGRAAYRAVTGLEPSLGRGRRRIPAMASSPV